VRVHQAGHVPACVLLCATLFLAGCGVEVAPQEISSGETLDCGVFQNTVAPIFDANIGGTTCSASGCHRVGESAGGAFKVHPNAALNSVEMEANYIAAKGFANLNDPTLSKLLLEPLAGAQSIVGSHAGGDIFPSTADVNYNTILAWISTRVQAPNSCLP
jgi:hypothetical protein